LFEFEVVADKVYFSKMKLNILLLAILLPLSTFCQKKDSTKTHKARNEGCKVVFGGTAENGTMPLSLASAMSSISLQNWADTVSCGEIFSFDLIVTSNGLMQEIPGKGTSLNDAMKSAIAHLTAGDIITIARVRYKTSDGLVHVAKSLTLTMK
jgi:hypothetical protein